MICSSTKGLFFGGKTASHISSKRRLPDIVESFFPIPSINAIPTPKSPSINSQSTIGFPARLTKNGLNGPAVPNFKNPSVGEFPDSHDLSAAVANPKPSSLSKNAHKKTQPMLILSRARKICCFIYNIIPKPFKNDCLIL